MDACYYKLWIHLTWTTKDRYPLIDKQTKPVLYSIIQEICKAHGYYLDYINGVEDHLHLLMQLKPKHSISDMVKNIKALSWQRMEALNMSTEYFSWQDGFAAFSVSHSDLYLVRNYIKNQEKHHEKISFTEELSKLLISQGLSRR